MLPRNSVHYTLLLLTGALLVVIVAHFGLYSLGVVDWWNQYVAAHQDWSLEELQFTLSALVLYALTVLFWQQGVNKALIRRLRANVQQRLSAERELRKALAARESFFAAMSHDLRTPVNSIIGFSEMIRGETFGGLGHPKYKEYAEGIFRAGSMLDNTISQILDVSRIASEGELVVRAEAFDPLPEIEFCRKLVTGWVGTRRKIEITGDIGGADILFDRALFRRYVINLLSNALKYAGADARIGVHLMAGSARSGVTLAIHDDGRGIATRAITEATHPFQQIHAPDEAYMNSAGLGLWIVKNIAQSHQCDFSITSDTGFGFRAILSIPVERVVAPTPTLCIAS